MIKAAKKKTAAAVKKLSVIKAKPKAGIPAIDPSLGFVREIKAFAMAQV